MNTYGRHHAYTPRMAGFVYCIHNSTEDPDRAFAALEQAVAAQRAGHTVDLWLSHEGVRLAVAAVAETIRDPGDAAALVKELVDNGATLHAHRPCFERRQFDPDALRPGGKVSDGGVLPVLLADDRRAVTV